MLQLFLKIVSLGAKGTLLFLKIRKSAKPNNAKPQHKNPTGKQKEVKPKDMRFLQEKSELGLRKNGKTTRTEPQKEKTKEERREEKPPRWKRKETHRPKTATTSSLYLENPLYPYWQPSWGLGGNRKDKRGTKARKTNHMNHKN